MSAICSLASVFDKTLLTSNIHLDNTKFYSYDIVSNSVKFKSLTLPDEAVYVPIRHIRHYNMLIRNKQLGVGSNKIFYTEFYNLSRYKTLLKVLCLYLGRAYVTQFTYKDELLKIGAGFIADKDNNILFQIKYKLNPDSLESPNDFIAEIDYKALNSLAISNIIKNSIIPALVMTGYKIVIDDLKDNLYDSLPVPTEINNLNEVATKTILDNFDFIEHMPQ